MMNKLNSVISIFASLLFFFSNHHAYADIAIIVHPSNTISSITSDEVKKIYLGKNKFFPNGNGVIAADQKDGDVRRKFYSEVVQKQGAALKSYWSKRIFSGKGTPPDVIGDDMAVKAWVSANTDGIGFISAEKVDGTVKIIYTISQ